MRASPAVSAAMCASGRTLAEPRLSSDGATVVFLSIDGGAARLVRMAADGGPEMVLTADRPPARAHPAGGGVHCWSGDNDAVVFVSGSALWRVGMNGGVATAVVDETAGLWAPVISPDGRQVAYTVEQASVWVAPLDRSNPPRRVPTTASFVMDPVWLDDRTLAWQAWDPPDMAWDSSRIESASLDGPVKVLVAGAQLQCQQPVVHRHGGLALLCDREGWLNVHRLVDGVLEAFVGEAFEHGDPTWGDRQRTLVWSPDGGAIAFCRNEDGFGRLCVARIDDGEVVVHDIGRGVHRSLDWQGERLVALRTGGVTPTQLVSYDAGRDGGGSWERTLLARGPVLGFEPALVEPETLRFRARDGVELHARRYRPARPHGGVICWVHGGPTDQWPVEFNARMAFVLARGWTVVVPDHRGSTGHGRAFTQALRDRWGDLDVSDVADVLAAFAHDASSAVTRTGPTVLMGASAGGFTVLNLMARHPPTVSGAIVLYPVSDLAALARGTHRFEAHYCDSLVGPMKRHTERYRQRSVHPEEISGPLLVFHGDADEVVDIDQSRALVAAVRAGGGVAELVEYPEEGHGWRRPATMLDELGRIEEFLAAHTPGDST